MPYRHIPIVVNQIYHIFNRSIAHQPIFLKSRDYARALETVKYYRYFQPGLRFSHYNRLPTEQQREFFNRLKLGSEKQVQIFAFSLMPNHVHFLIKEVMNKGISNFMRNLQNSYAKYFNMKMKRSGALFLSMFKAVRIETDEQFLHVARYIHLNPLTSYILSNTKELEKYPWSSFHEYTGKRETDIVDTSKVRGYFATEDDFKRFTFDQLSYQRELERIKHLVCE